MPLVVLHLVVSCVAVPEGACVDFLLVVAVSGWHVILRVAPDVADWRRSAEELLVANIRVRIDEGWVRPVQGSHWILVALELDPIHGVAGDSPQVAIVSLLLISLASGSLLRDSCALVAPLLPRELHNLLLDDRRHGSVSFSCLIRRPEQVLAQRGLAFDKGHLLPLRRLLFGCLPLLLGEDHVEVLLAAIMLGQQL